MLEMFLCNQDRDGLPAQGNKDLGYYGEVPADKFITGSSLASQMGIATSNPVDLNSPWLKFAFKGKILYIAKHPLVNFISWQALNNAGVVDGTRTVRIDGRLFKVRLITGVNDGTGEWNNLIYRVHASDPTATYWARFSNADLYVGVGDGRTTWCQEMVSNRYVYRGYGSLTDYQTGLIGSATATTGWRPVLELVE